MGTLLFSIIFLILGSAVLFFFLACIWGGLAELFPSINIPGYLRKKRYEKIAADLDRIDSAIEERNYKVAQSLILQALILESTPSAKYHYDVVNQHNFAVFTKAVLLLDACDSQSRNLPVLEKEFQSRASLLRLYNDAITAKQKITKKDSSAESKQWATKEMDGKISSILSQIRENGELLLREMKALLAAINTNKNSNDVKYH